MAEQDPDLFDLDTGFVLEQGDELLRKSRDLLAELDRQLDSTQSRDRDGVHNPGDNLRKA